MNSIFKLTPFVAALLLVPGASHAGVEIAPFLGWLQPVTNVEAGNPDLEFDDQIQYGVTVGIPVLGPDQVELMYSKYESALRSRGPGQAKVIDVDFTYLHIGGHWEHGRGPGKMFAIASAGILDIDPKGNFFDDDTLLSAGLGGGGKHFFNERVGLKAEGRILANYLDGEGEVFCNSAGCLGKISGSFLWQFQASVGLVLRLGN